MLHLHGNNCLFSMKIKCKPVSAFVFQKYMHKLIIINQWCNQWIINPQWCRAVAYRMKRKWADTSSYCDTHLLNASIHKTTVRSEILSFQWPWRCTHVYGVLLYLCLCLDMVTVWDSELDWGHHALITPERTNLIEVRTEKIKSYFAYKYKYV